jgi:hypothetical protein
VRASGSPADDRLSKTLAEVLCAAGVGEPVELLRACSPRRSTFPLEELRVILGDGEELRLAFKRLEWKRLVPETRIAKPGFVFDARREPAVYSTLLGLAPAGPARYFGSVGSDGGEGSWLFVEWVDGHELYEAAELSLWLEAARWLGALHVALAEDIERHIDQAHLLEHDRAHCMEWVERASRFAGERGRASEAARFLERLRRRYGVVVEALLDLPRTVVHGDFYASNVLTAAGKDAVRVAPVDWEMAAAAPGLMDLAALISGDWSQEGREAIVGAYASSEGVAPFSPRQLDLARLHHAVQRLGWAPACWSPPPEQRYDWLTEAIELAETLEI